MQRRATVGFFLRRGSAAGVPQTGDNEGASALWSDDDIARAMREGFSPGVVTLCPEMTRFSRMGDDEARALRYVQGTRKRCSVVTAPPRFLV